MKISAIVAAGLNNEIGCSTKEGGMLWHLPNDFKFFKNTTVGKAVIMGSGTFESIGRRALPNRLNVIVTSDPGRYALPEPNPNIVFVTSVEDAIEAARGFNEAEAFIIGGGRVYEQTKDAWDTLYLTTVHAEFDDADVFFPDLRASEWNEAETVQNDADEKHPHAYTFHTYTRNR